MVERIMTGYELIKQLELVYYYTDETNTTPNAYNKSYK